MKDNQAGGGAESISFAKGTLVFTFESIYYIITTSSGAFAEQRHETERVFISPRAIERSA